MNKSRRKTIASLVSKIEDVFNEASTQLENIKEEIEEVLSEEQECFDNIPENLEGSERYEAAENAVENLESAVESIEELIDNLDCDELIEYLNNAAE